MSIGDNIRKLRESRGLTQTQLADKLGISNKTVSSWEVDECAKTPRMGVIERIATLFGVPKSEIIDGARTVVNAFPVGNFVPVRVAGAVRAGFGGVAFEEFSGYEYADVRHPENYIYLRVVGDSMSPHINDGDLALIRIQDDVENGQIAVVVINGDEGTIKKVVKNDHSIVLQPFNGAYETRIFTGPELEDLHIAGLVVKTERKWA